MRARSLTLFLSFFIASSSALAAGSWSSGGGGTGIACFVSKASAMAIHKGADLNSRPDLVADLDSVLLTDIWENQHAFYAPPLDGETPQAYVERLVADRLKASVPVFYGKVESALAQVEAGWSMQSQPLPASHDTGEIEVWPADRMAGPRQGGDDSPLSSNCAQVQIALRKTASGRGETARVSVAVNEALYTHLGIGDNQTRICNQGALLLHEALYMIAQTLGHKTSFDARRLTSALLSNTKIAALHDYENAFESQNPKVVTPDRTALSNELNLDGFGMSRPASGASEIQIGIVGFQAAERKLNIDLKSASDAKSERLELNFAEQLTPAESFAAVGNTALGRGLIPDLATLADSSADGHAQALSAVCAFARAKIQSEDGDNAQVAAVGSTFKKAQSFCQSQHIP